MVYTALAPRRQQFHVEMQEPNNAVTTFLCGYSECAVRAEESLTDFLNTKINSDYCSYCPSSLTTASYTKDNISTLVTRECRHEHLQLLLYNYRGKLSKELVSCDFVLHN